MAHIDRKQAHEIKPHVFGIDHSDLRDQLPVGVWPFTISTNLGNGQSLVRTSKAVDEEGDIQWVTYEQSNGCIRVRIYND